jgi:phage terminase large subunit-like protein
MIVLAHLVGPEAKRNSQIRSGAQSRDQAAIVFNYAAKMVRMSPEIAPMVTIRDSVKELLCHVTGVHYKALSAEASTAHGQSPVLVIHDELGQVTGPRSDLYSALETAMGAHDEPMSLIISTQAPTDADLLSTLIDSAVAINDERYKVFLDEVPADEEDIYNPKVWLLANPALGDFLSMAEMQSLADTAKRLPAQEASFRNLNLNQRVAAEDHFLAPAVWKLNNAVSDFSVLQVGDVYIGADLSSTQDLTSVIAGAKALDTGKWHLKIWFFLPKVGLKERAKRDRVPYDVWADKGLIHLTPGKSIDEDAVADVIKPVLMPLRIKQFGYDRWQFESLRKALARKSDTQPAWEPPFLQDFGQGFKSMTPALKEVERLALDGMLCHGDHPILRMCAENCRVVTDDAGNRKLTKRRSIGRIDGMVALTTMIGASIAPVENNESVYERRGLMILE